MADTSSATRTKTDPEAPHGRDEETGVPLAPYGFKTDGTPRVSNRGRPAQAKKTPGAGAPTKGAAGARAKSQKELLLQLADAVITPAMGAAASPALARRLGPERAAGVAGSLVIVDGFMPAYVDQVVSLAGTKPGLLAWMDRIDDSAPYMGIAILTAQLVKAVSTNLMNPDPKLYRAARLKPAIRAAQMAEAVEAEAARMGIRLDDPAAREHPEAA